MTICNPELLRVNEEDKDLECSKDVAILKYALLTYTIIVIPPSFLLFVYYLIEWCHQNDYLPKSKQQRHNKIGDSRDCELAKDGTELQELKNTSVE